MTLNLSWRNRISSETTAENLATIPVMPTVDPKIVGARLRAIMSDPDLRVSTVDDFAGLVGEERNAASAWLNGYNLPRVATMAKLIEKYPGLTLDWIYLGIADAIPVGTYIKLQALMEGLRVPVVEPEPEPAATAKKRRASRKRATFRNG